MDDTDRCVVCGEIVPEGRMVCPDCEMREAEKLRQYNNTRQEIRRNIAEIMNQSEQWKNGGDCRICRRAAYCSKRCKASEKRITAEVMARFRKTAAGRLYDMICGNGRC